MRRILLVLIAALLLPSAAFAQLNYQPSGQGPVGPYVTATDPSGNSRKVVLQAVTQVDSAGADATGAPGTGITQPAGGSGVLGWLSGIYKYVLGSSAPVTAGAATATTSTLMGCQYNSTPDTFTNGQQGHAACGTRGSLNVTLCNQDVATCFVAITGGADGLGATQNLGVGAYEYNFNGTTFDRQFTCSSSASVSVTAGNTTQIVALASSKVIRVCSLSLGISANGSVGVYYGTGSNCATGATALVQDMVLNSGAIWAVSSSNGSLYRTATSNALCIKAVTGNVTGFISYSQY